MVFFTIALVPLILIPFFSTAIAIIVNIQLAKAEHTETASDTLKQAITTMDMTVEGFVSSQGYKNQEQRDALLQTLEPIAV